MGGISYCTELAYFRHLGNNVMSEKLEQSWPVSSIIVAQGAMMKLPV